MELRTLNDLFVDQLKDLYNAEQQLIRALPKMASAASNDELREAFAHHLTETQDHVRRITDIFGGMGVSPGGETCEAMEGLIREGDKVIAAQGDPAVKDAALIAAAQRVEHYEIAAYGTARTLASELGLSNAESMLDDTLDEEAEADKLLTKIATGGLFHNGVNQEAAAKS